MSYMTIFLNNGYIHSENGLLAFGPPPAKGEEDPELINAGKEFVTLLQGGSYFHHGDSFAMMRGGHLDIAVLGAFQVAANGDLANWHTGKPDAIPAVGGAMDLASGARNVFVMMEYLTKEGHSKILKTCSYPLTGLACVNRVYTEVATFEFANGKVYVIDIVAPYDLDYIKKTSEIELDYSKLK